MAGLPLLTQRDPLLLELSGVSAIRRFASELLREGVDELYIDLSPEDRACAESLEEFLGELDRRLQGKGGPAHH